jgi:hypothetical protein
MHSNHPALRQTFATQSRHWNRRLLVRLNATAPVWLTALHRSCARYRGIAAAGFEHSISPTMTLLSPRISRCCLSLIMDRRPTSARTARPRHLSAVSNFQIDVSRGRRTASSGMLALVSHCLQLTSSQSGRCGSLHLHRDGLPPSTFCRLYFYSITSLARPTSGSEKVRPSALAVFRFMMNSTLEICSTGRSAGLSPLRILPTKMPTLRYPSARLGA